MLRVDTAEAFAQAMNNAGIRYVTMSGLYGYPDSIGRDLDLLIRRKDAPSAITLAEQIRDRFGWDAILLRWFAYNAWQLFFIRKGEEELSWLEIDLIHEDAIMLGAAPLIEDFEEMVDSADSYHGPFPLNKVASYVKAQLRPILYGDLKRFEAKYSLQPVDDANIRQYLRRLMGSRTAERFIAATYGGAADLRNLCKELKWAINRKFMMRHPLRFTHNLIWSRLIRPWKLYRHSSGLVFAVANPDAEIEDSVFERAVDYFKGCFQVRRAEFTDGSSKSFKGARSKPSMVRSLRNAVRLLFRLNMRYYLRDRFLPKSVIQFVLYNGSPREPVVKPCRFGIRPGILPRLLGRWTPKPIEVLQSSKFSTDELASSAPNALKALPPQPSKMMEGKALGRAIVGILEGLYAISSNRELKQIRSKPPF